MFPTLYRSCTFLRDQKDSIQKSDTSLSSLRHLGERWLSECNVSNTHLGQFMLGVQVINMKANIERSRDPQLPVYITVSLRYYFKQSLRSILYGLQNGGFSRPSIPESSKTSVTWTRVRVSVSDSGAGVRFVRIFGDTANNTWIPTRVRGIRLGKKIKTRVSG